MKVITQDFGGLFHPCSALLIYKNANNQSAGYYVEAYDIGKNGNPINAHPLSLKESAGLAAALDISKELKRSFLKPKGLLSNNILYINPDSNGFVLWHTPKMSADLIFTDSLGLRNGSYALPRLLWKASRTTLHVYAIMDTAKLCLDTALCHAPFFNIYEDGSVCMGTVNIEIDSDSCLEDFIHQWQQYFFNSRFSHLIMGRSHVKINIIDLYQNLALPERKFSQNILIKNGITLKKLIR